MTHEIAAPNGGDVPPVLPPAFSNQRGLTAKGSANAIVGKLSNNLAGIHQPRSQGVKRKVYGHGTIASNIASRPQTAKAAPPSHPPLTSTSPSHGNLPTAHV